jgi:hypothetical protein
VGMESRRIVVVGSTLAKCLTTAPGASAAGAEVMLAVGVNQVREPTDSGIEEA